MILPNWLRWKTPSRTHHWAWGWNWFLAVLLLVVTFTCLGIGAVSISVPQIVAIFAAQVGLKIGVAYAPQHEYVLLHVRLPRVLLGILVGGGLALAGAALQGLYRNPLADPGLIGVSGGAALFAAAALAPNLFGVVTWTAWGYFSVPIAAFIGGLLFAWLVYALASRSGKVNISTMLLVGIALNALSAAGVGLILFGANEAQLRAITFWRLGSLGGATWAVLAGVVPLILLTMWGLPKLARALNLLLLGEAEARHLGIEVERVRRLVITYVALAVGSAVAVSGIIGFVGLVVPHLLRLVLGSDHRRLLPASIMLGASLLLVADLLARTLAVPAELPIGVITAFVGTPFFLILVMKRKAHL